MIEARKIILICMLILLVNPFVFSEETRQNKNILILFSFVPSTPAYRVITEGIRTSLTRAYGDGFNLHMEYLETERYPKGEYPKERFELYNEKYKDIRLDLLICVGIGIIEPVKKNACGIILNLPAITIDFDLSEYGFYQELNLNDRTAVIGMKLNIMSTLNTALSLLPDVRSVYFISGISSADRMYLNVTRAIADKFDKHREYTFITDISMDDVLRMVRKLPDSSIIVIPGFNMDSKGVQYYNPESIRLISQAANAPVFSYSDMGFGDGTVGGYILSFNNIGLLAGETALKILHGTNPAEIIITEKDIYNYLFDWRELKRWGLVGSKRIPEGSMIRFEDVSFFQTYRLIITIGILFLVLQSLLILNLVRLYRKQKLFTRRLIDSENKFRDLVREDRVLRLGQLTASLSHELNQPLTAILSTAQAGLRFIESKRMDPSLMKEILENIVEDDKRTASILSSIRGMMKLEKREKERVNLNALIEEIINIYQSETMVKKINLNIKLTDQPVYIFADRIQIQQVILNFFTNATQAIENIKAIDRTVVISENVNNDFVTVSVRDYGQGFEESLKDKIFQPFISSKKEGLGIGLAISSAIIDDHQGKIWAENMPGGGAMFSFSLKII
jgi:signal transduction histidine kinase